MYRLIEPGKQFVREEDTFGTRDVAIDTAMKRSVKEEYVYHSWTAVPDKRLVAHEVIVLDDNSTDHTAAIVREMDLATAGQATLRVNDHHVLTVVEVLQITS